MKPIEKELKQSNLAPRSIKAYRPFSTLLPSIRTAMLKQKRRMKEKQLNDRYKFKLIPFDENCFIRNSIVVDYGYRENTRANLRSTAPTFNRDGRVWSPSFIAYAGQSFKQKSLKKHESNFYKKLETYSMKASEEEEDTSILVPLPANSNFCKICLKEFSDYLSHITKAEHKSNLSESLGQAYIDDLVCHYSSRSRRWKSKKQIKKEKERQRREEIKLKIYDLVDEGELKQPQSKTQGGGENDKVCLQI